MKTTLILFITLFSLLSFSQKTENQPTSFCRNELKVSNQKFAVYENTNNQIFMTEIIDNQEKEKLLPYCIIDVYNLYMETIEEKKTATYYSIEEIKKNIDSPEMLDRYLKRMLLKKSK